tara:strand:- start:2476 stop:3390 length:915 start_codon:yes stop_codon:yes gene_type:complete
MAEQAQALETENYAGKEQTIGEILRATRVHYEQSLQDIERTLRIRECQIEAIENGDIEKLPGRVYAIGFVRSYAEYLDLDGDQAVDMFKRQYLSNVANEKPSLPIPAEESKVPAFWLVLLSLIMVGAGIYYWTSLQYNDRTAIEYIPPVPERVEARSSNLLNEPEDIIKEEASVLEQVPKNVSVLNEESADETEMVIEDNSVAPEEVVNKKGIILNIKEDSWVEIKDQNRKILVSEVLKTGDQYFVPDSPGLTMSLGNAGGVEIVVNGKALQPLGKKSQVRRNIPLNVDHLMQFELQEEPSSSE